MPERARRRVAIVTHGFDQGGGVRTIARWMWDTLEQTGDYEVDLHNLATWSADPGSRRLIRPRTWMRPSLAESRGVAAWRHWGANAVEVEWMRYRPRRELSAALRRCDLVQVVSGTPVWAGVALGLGVPVVLQVATLAVWERARLLTDGGGPANSWRRLMTAGVSVLDRRALQRVDAVLVENARMAAVARSVGSPRVVLAPPGVDTDLFTPAATGWHPHGHLLSVCRLGDPRKGLDLMIKAYALMVRQDPATPVLVLAGKGRLPDGVVSLIDRLDLAERVLVRSDVPAAELVDLYRRASVFLQTSHEEGLGLSVIEAMACGLPVVATATVGAGETVADGVTGWLVPLEPVSGVPAAVAARARVLLDGSGGEFGRRARERAVARFSTQIAVRDLLATYDEVLSGRAGSRTVPRPGRHGRGTDDARPGADRGPRLPRRR